MSTLLEAEEGTYIFEGRVSADNPLRVTDTENLQDPNKAKHSLLTISNTHGLIACGTQDGVVLVETKNIHKHFQTEHKTPTNIQHENVILQTTSQPSIVVFSNDGSHLAVACESVLEVFPSKGILNSGKSATHKFTSAIAELAWHKNAIIVVESTGAATVVSVSGSTTLEVHARASVTGVSTGMS